MKFESVKRKVESIVRSRLGDDRVERLWLEHSTNVQGDPILRIFVVHKGGEPPLTAKEMQGVTSELWELISELGQPDLVIPSFVAAEDARTLRSA